MKALLARTARALRARKRDAVLDDELRFHVESEAQALVARGVPADEARRRAMATLGGYERWRDEVRETRVSWRAELLWRDVRLALRALMRAPAYSLPVVATLALGIAAMASITSLAWDVLVRPLPYEDPQRLVAVYERNIPNKRERNVPSVVALEAWRTRSRTLDSVSAMVPASHVWIGAAGAERVSGAEVSPSLLALLGRHPMLGAGFTSSPAAHEIIVSHSFWQSRLGGDSAVVGTSVRLDGEPYTVVGVMPASFSPLKFGWMSTQEYWTPFLVTPEKVSWGRFLLVAARLRPGATLEEANRDVQAIHAQLRTDSQVEGGWDAQVIAMTDEIGRVIRPSLVALVVAGALLLLMVLTNTSLLAIAEGRRRAADRALRGVLGATNGRLARESAITAMLLAGAGSMFALLLSAWAIPTLARFLPPDVPRLDSVRFGLVTLVVASSTGLVALAVLALVPMRGVAGAAQSFTHAGTRLTHRRQGGWVVVAEAATAVVLVLFAALTLRSFDRLAAVDLGFDASRLMAFRIAFETPGVPAARAAVQSREFLASLRSAPGVVAAGRTTVRPLYQGGTATTIARAGEAARDPSTQPTADVRLVDDGYFRTMALPAKSGRVFAADEPPAGALRAVVSEALVQALWPGATNVIGRSFELNVDNGLRPEIVGVVRDLRIFNPRSAPRPAVYLSTEQKSWGEEFDVLVRTSGEPADILPLARQAARVVAPAAPIYRVESMQASRDDVVARERVTAQLLVFFGAAALLLVAVGVYGLYAGEVTRRRREIGVRMALGETAAAVVRALLGRALLGTMVGVGVGMGIGVAVTRILTSVLFGIAPTDAVTYAGAAAVVTLTALAATVIPAVHAAAVSPGEALRE